jgi:hypothetical protein
MQTVAGSHEIAEATSDPRLNAFYLTSNDAWSGTQSLAGGENGDMCENVANNTYNESGWSVQRIWSNKAAAASQQPCQPWDDQQQPYFAAAVRTPPIIVNSRSTAGYVTVQRGKSIDVIADVFSEGPLAHDVLLYAGTNKGFMQKDPSDVGPPGDYLTVNLSRMQVHNGNAVTMTITAPSNAQSTDVPMILRAVFDATNYNDWPIIVRVK